MKTREKARGESQESCFWLLSLQAKEAPDCCAPTLEIGCVAQSLTARCDRGEIITDSNKVSLF